MCFASTKGASSAIAAAFSFAAATAVLREQLTVLSDRTIVPNENGPAGESVAKAAAFRNVGIPLDPTPAAIVEAARLEDQSATAGLSSAQALASGLIDLFERAESGRYSSETRAALRLIAEGIMASKEASDAVVVAYESANAVRAEAMTD